MAGRPWLQCPCRLGHAGFANLPQRNSLEGWCSHAGRLCAAGAIPKPISRWKLRRSNETHVLDERSRCIEKCSTSKGPGLTSGSQALAS